MKILGYGQANIEDIKRYEMTTGCQLPDDYKQFLLEYNGGCPEQEENYIIIPKVKSEKIRLRWFAGVTIGGEVCDYKNYLFKLVREFEGMIDPKIHIPFARPYGYYSLILCVSEEMSGIYLYDYSVRLKESSKKKVLHKICDTFTEFLELIVANEQ